MCNLRIHIFCIFLLSVVCVGTAGAQLYCDCADTTLIFGCDHDSCHYTFYDIWFFIDLCDISYVDSCGPVSLSSSLEEGETFPLGRYTPTLTLTSQCGESACFDLPQFEVKDMQAPSGGWYGPIDYVVANSLTCGAFVHFRDSLQFEDNCSAVTVECSPESGSWFPVGYNTVSITATDTYNNKYSTSISFDVVDLNDPVFTFIPDDIYAYVDFGQSGDYVTYPGPSGWDACGICLIETYPESGSFFPLGGNNVACQIGDCNGNLEYTSFDVYVIEGSDPGGDLTVSQVDPIQVVYNPNAFVSGKPTVAKVSVYSTFSTEVYVDFSVSIDLGGSVRASDYNVRINPGSNWIYLPGGPSSASSNPWSTEYFTVNALHDQARVQVTVDPFNTLEEHNESNNSGFSTPLNIIESDNSLKILFQNWKLPDACGSDPGLSPVDFHTTVMNSAYFINSTYPITDLDWFAESRIESGSCSSNPGDTKDLQRLEKILRLKKPAYNRIVGIASSDYFDYKYPGSNGAHSTLAANDAAIVLAGYYTSAAHEVQHSYHGWRTGLVWPWGSGGGEEYETNPNMEGNNASGFWISERDIIDANGTLTDPGICFMGARSDHPGDFKYWYGYPHNWRDYWICNECYNHMLSEFGTGSKFTEIEASTILITGSLDKNNTLILDPIVLLDSTYVSDIDSGNSVISFYDEQDLLLDEFYFHMDFYTTTDPPGLIELDTVHFAYTFPLPEEVKYSVKRTSISYDQAVQVDRIASDNQPQVTVLYPNGGECLPAGTEHEFIWQGYDVDGDSLLYFVMMSANMGSSWNVIALDIADTSFTWSTTSTTFGSEFLVKVIATDGFNTTSDVTDLPFTVEALYRCGDADGSDSVDIDDVVYLINYIFAGGPTPEPYESGDANCSGGVDIDDVVYLIAYIFSGGPPPGDLNNDGLPDC